MSFSPARDEEPFHMESSSAVKYAGMFSSRINIGGITKIVKSEDSIQMMGSGSDQIDK